MLTQCQLFALLFDGYAYSVGVRVTQEAGAANVETGSASRR
jgi:hypothetical protein